MDVGESRARPHAGRHAGRHARRRQRGGWPLAMALGLLGFLVLLVIGMVAAAVAFSGLVWLWALVPLGCVLVAFVGGVITDAPAWCGLTVLGLGVLSAITLGAAIDGSVLFARGVTVRASVVGVSEYTLPRSIDITYQYALAKPGGAPVPGGTYDVQAYSAPGPYRVGDAVTVVYDPEGVVPPAAPDAAQPQTELFVVAAIPVVAMLGGLVWWGVRAGRPRSPSARRPEPDTGSPNRGHRGRTGGPRRLGS